MILPILDWTDNVVAEFVNETGIKCHELYYDDEGIFHPERRLGCIGCPMSIKNQIKDFQKYPKMLKQWIRHGSKFLETHHDGRAKQKYLNVYNLMYSNLFCSSFEEYNTMVVNQKLNCKQYLEDYFKIDL